VDLPASGTYDYVLKAKAFREGVPCGCKVTFTNPRTGEYLFHDVAVTVTPPGTMETIKLEAACRAVVRHLITVDNPLPASSPITFGEGNSWWSCADPCVRLVRLGAMAGNSEGTFQVEYRPLAVGKGGSGGGAAVETALEFRIAELGAYKYTLALVALPPASEPPLRFEASLGASQQATFTCRAFSKAAASFACAVAGDAGACFEVVGGPSVPVPASSGWEGTEVKVAVRFEPSALGPAEGTLEVTPSDGGAPYVVRLAGTCRRPQPQGPFDVACNGARDVPVRNVFADDKEYVFTVDHPAFSVANPRATIKAKDSANCNVKFSAPAGTGEVSAKLIVSCPSAPDMPPWVFYLRGRA
jgi:hypothetical protein